MKPSCGWRGSPRPSPRLQGQSFGRTLSCCAGSCCATVTLPLVAVMTHQRSRDNRVNTWGGTGLLTQRGLDAAVTRRAAQPRGCTKTRSMRLPNCRGVGVLHARGALGKDRELEGVWEHTTKKETCYKCVLDNWSLPSCNLYSPTNSNRESNCVI